MRDFTLIGNRTTIYGLIPRSSDFERNTSFFPDYETAYKYNRDVLNNKYIVLSFNSAKQFQVWSKLFDNSELNDLVMAETTELQNFSTTEITEVTKQIDVIFSEPAVLHGRRRMSRLSQTIQAIRKSSTLTDAEKTLRENEHVKAMASLAYADWMRMLQGLADVQRTVLTHWDHPVFQSYLRDMGLTADFGRLRSDDKTDVTVEVTRPP
jgi:hypothetical protein